MVPLSGVASSCCSSSGGSSASPRAPRNTAALTRASAIALHSSAGYAWAPFVLKWPSLSLPIRGGWPRCTQTLPKSASNFVVLAPMVVGFRLTAPRAHWSNVYVDMWCSSACSRHRAVAQIDGSGSLPGSAGCSLLAVPPAVTTAPVISRLASMSVFASSACLRNLRGRVGNPQGCALLLSGGGPTVFA